MTAVIKLGGSVLEPAPTAELVTALAAAAREHDLALVHGGGKALSGLLGRLGISTEFRKGLRVTDAATLEAAVMAFGAVNTQLVASLNAAGVRAVGLTGCDAASLPASRRADWGAVGEPLAADARLWQTLLAAGYTPVIASLGCEAGSGSVLNVNADQCAAAVARALGAGRLLFVTDVDGIYNSAGRTLEQATLAELEALQAAGALGGGMLPKAAACAAALHGGVAEVSIAGPVAARSLSSLLAGGVIAGTRLTL